MHLAAANGLEEPLRESVHDGRTGRMPDDFEKTVPSVLGELEPELIALLEEARRRFEEAEVQAGLLLPRSLAEKMHAEDGLAGARRAKDEGGGAVGRSPSHHLVQIADAEAAALATDLRDLAGHREPRLDAGVHSHAIASNLEEMCSAKVVASAKLQDHELPHGANAVHHVIELDEAVDHRSRGVRTLVLEIVGEQDGGAAEHCDHDVQLVDEDLELLGGFSGTFGGDDPVDHQQRGTEPLDGLADEVEQALQLFGVKDFVSADILNGLPDDVGVVEAHRRNVGEHPPVRFREQADVQRLPTECDVAEGDLVTEDRLAGTRVSRDDVAPTLQEAAVENDVELFDPGGEAGNALRTHPLGPHAVVPPDSLPALFAVRGSSTVKVAPAPGELSTWTVPPKASMSLS